MSSNSAEFNVWHLLVVSFFPVLVMLGLVKRHRPLPHTHTGAPGEADDGDLFTAFFRQFEGSSSSFDTLLMAAGLVTAICLLLHWKSTVYKLKLYSQIGVYWLLGAKDAKVKPLSYDPGSLPVDQATERRTVIFIRHGESTWNDTFNKGHRKAIVFIALFIPNLIYALAFEFYLLLSGARDSWFYDSPLSFLGARQSESLAEFLRQSNQFPAGTPQAAAVACLQGISPQKSILVCSNLRRALSTVCIGLQGRLTRTGEKIVVLPQLQEMSRNPDTLSITPKFEQPVPSWIDRAYSAGAKPSGSHLEPCNIAEMYGNQIDVTKNTGSKTRKVLGQMRLEAFAKWCFVDNQAPVVIAGGHSLWFRNFFRTFMGRKNDHNAKTKKIVNGGAVMFTLLRIPDTQGTGSSYKIDASSIQIIYGGFA